VKLPVPLCRQPSSVTCFPACVWSVLRYQGQGVSYEELEEACLLDELGAVDELAMQGLREAGWDVELLQDPTLNELEASFDEDRPVIALLALGAVGTQVLLHAVVLCGLEGEVLTVMDPLVGEYVDLTITEVRQIIAPGFNGMRVAGIPLKQAA
jgi:ABC-type bacteriocin/lantibiotic exporter with double-glycine peptidase domain